MSKAPERCLYCDGHGNSTAGGECGFCDHGKPLDTQEDWDRSWGFLNAPHREDRDDEDLAADLLGEQTTVTERADP